MMIKELPIGISTFPELIQKDYVYVDKTDIIYTIISKKKYYFLNRPRRFGKSLLISTIETIFTGNKDLFSGLAISTLPYDWQIYPIISISFAGISSTTPEALENGIKRYLQKIAKKYHCILKEGTSGEMLQELVETLAIQNSVVLLIDEYDYPILQHIHDNRIAAQMRDTLKNFYGIIKDLDKHLRFVFFTGVSKFANTSLFSGLNNLQDIGLKPEYNNLLGYTATEITRYFEPHLIQAAHKIGCSVEQLLIDITAWYDGYQFTIENNATKIYNPFSVLLFLDNKRFSNYWFQTGTPTFLINLLKTKEYPIQDFEHIEATESDLNIFDIDTIPFKTLLFQTGYITISHYNPETRNYILTYPNRETTDSLIEYIFVSMTHQYGAHLNNIVADLKRAFEHHDYAHLQKTLTQLYASVPYTIHIGEEKYYQTIFYLAFKLAGADIVVEQPTNIGRLDAVIQTKNNCFIIEFKINASAATALEQIKHKK